MCLQLHNIRSKPVKGNVITCCDQWESSCLSCPRKWAHCNNIKMLSTSWTLLGLYLMAMMCFAILEYFCTGQERPPYNDTLWRMNIHFSTSIWNSAFKDYFKLVINLFCFKVLLPLVLAWTNGQVADDMGHHGAHVTALWCWYSTCYNVAQTADPAQVLTDEIFKLDGPFSRLNCTD